jgi:hypothetical protein
MKMSIIFRDSEKGGSLFQMKVQGFKEERFLKKSLIVKTTFELEIKKSKS